MTQPDSTCWTVIHQAADGSPNAREEFARTYVNAIRAYLRARWSGSPLISNVDDATQEVFVECFRDQGALQRATDGETKNFRPYLYGLVRNIARRHERPDAISAKQTDGSVSKLGLAVDESSLSQVFDRAWARMIMKNAGERHRELAGQSGEAAMRRVDLLEKRFQQGLPIRHIADEWQVDAGELHREYAKARKEFREALIEVVRFHRPGSNAEIDQEVKNLLSLLA